MVFLNGFNRGEIETIFFFPAPFAQRICTTRTVGRTRSWLPVDIHSGKLVARGCEPWWRIASSLSDTRSSLSLSLCLSSLAAASRAGELMRGCRLDADNAGGVWFAQSSMILCSSLSSPPLSSPLLRSFSRLLAYLLIVLPPPPLLLFFLYIYSFPISSRE